MALGRAVGDTNTADNTGGYTVTIKSGGSTMPQPDFSNPSGESRILGNTAGVLDNPTAQKLVAAVGCISKLAGYVYPPAKYLSVTISLARARSNEDFAYFLAGVIPDPRVQAVTLARTCVSTLVELDTQLTALYNCAQSPLCQDWLLKRLNLR